MKKYILVLILVIFSLLKAEEFRAVWCPVWDIDSREKIDELIDDVYNSNMNTIIAEVRYRSDAMYVPNRISYEFKNNEPRCYVLNNQNFDPLEYIIEKSNPKGIKVIAWVTTFVATPKKLDSVDKKHLYYEHPDWITYDNNFHKMPINVLEGAFVDPGIPEVQDYIASVILDIVQNYNIDGIQLDYIRYPGRKYGYNPIARKLYKSQVEFETSNSWSKWKQDQVSRFMKRIYMEIKSFRPKLLVTAAVMANPEDAKNSYSQDWISWLKNGYLDYAFSMSYNSSNTAFKRTINNLNDYALNKKIVLGIRAWKDNGVYPTSKIIRKIQIAENYDFSGESLFFHGSLSKYEKYNDLRNIVFYDPVDVPSPTLTLKGNLYGRVKNFHNKLMQNVEVTLLDVMKTTTTDANGFYFFPNIDYGIYSVKASYLNKTIFSENINLKPLTTSLQYDFRMDSKAKSSVKLSADVNDGKVKLSWKVDSWSPISIYKRGLNSSKEGKLFELTDIIADSTSMWIDKVANLKKEYQYKLILSNGASSNVITVRPN